MGKSGKALLDAKASKTTYVFTREQLESHDKLVCENFKSRVMVSDGTLWEVLTALYFRWTCLPDCAVPELDADYRRNNRRLS